MDDSDDVGEEEEALYDKEEVIDEEDEEQDVNEVDKAKDEEKKSKKIEKLMRRQMKTRNTCPLILMTLMKKVMQVCQPMFIQRPRNRAVTTL
jgi:hypothetical protein